MGLEIWAQVVIPPKQGHLLWAISAALFSVSFFKTKNHWSGQFHRTPVATEHFHSRSAFLRNNTNPCPISPLTCFPQCGIWSPSDLHPLGPTGTADTSSNREWSGGGEDLRTHPHQALHFVFSPTEGKMSTNHWEQGQWKNWPSKHICFQSSENLISTCGLLRLFFFSFRCWMRVGGLFLIPPLQSVSGLHCCDRHCRCGDSSIRKSEGYYAKRGQRTRAHSPHPTASSSSVTFLSLLRN